MALSNSQYDLLMRDYEQKRLHNQHVLSAHFEEIYEKIPKIKEIDDEISSLSLAQARVLLSGDGSALTRLKESLAQFRNEKKNLLMAAGFPSDYLEIHYSCPDCKDTGYIGSEKCHCFKKAIVDLLYTQSNLKNILEKENFGTFDQSFYSKNYVDDLTGRSSYDSIQVALKTSLDFVESFGKDSKNILFYGDTGVGKTFLSHCIAKELMDRSHSVIYFSASQLFDFFAKTTFGKKDAEAGEDISHVYECDLLIIDDLGTEVPNSFTISQLFTCLNQRIQNGKSTIISTNLSLDNINTIYSERIFSRITSNFAIVRLIGDDIRIQKKLLNLGGTI